MADTLVISLPEDVSAELKRLAQEDGVTPEQMLARMAEARVRGIRSAREFFAERARGADREALRRILNREGGEPPRPGDEAD